MKRTLAALLPVLVWGCGGGAAPGPEPRPAPPSEAKPAMSPEAKPPASSKPEPEHITVAHVLISFQGTGTDAKRSKAEAEKLAGEVLARARKGEDFDQMMKDLSDDPGGGAYMMSNLGVRPTNPDEFPRNKMVAAFGDVGFKLEVGGIGMSTYDPRTSPYGWHIIKRLK
ncbi:MAG TPA: peptidylprolyl isomerase [Planctomycetota bacterium]|nr:peptidylprolyl isomerase [Planctomycetota bacterium]